jgi:4-hydroxy-2-oxoheptanedioate aldolase
MRVNHVKQRLRQGEPSIGTWFSLPSPEAAEQVSQLPFDWIVIDSEHNAVDIRTLAQMFMAMSNTGIAPMVRIPWNAPENFKRVLDAGAWGIVVPMVNSREEAEQAVQATRYYPEGNRSVGGGRHAISFGTSGADYFKNANEQILLVAMIEHIDGVEHADEILSTPGIDACFIGPNDMAASMGLGLGHPLESVHPRMIEAIEHVRQTCVKNGVATGIHTSGAEAVNMRIGQGFQFCAMASELRYMVGSLKEDIDKLDWKASTRGTTEAAGPVAEAGVVVRY